MNSVIKIVSMGIIVSLASFGSVHVEPASFANASSVSFELVGPARADVASSGYDILKCFHPSANFVRASIGDEYFDSNGRRTRNGSIDFRGGWSGNSYRMTFVIHTRMEHRDTMVRITPLTDNAPFVPNPNCSYREWTRVQ